MKKRTAVIVLCLFIIAMTSTVFAINVEDPMGQQLLRRGYTEHDIEELNAVLVLSDENVIEFVVQRYDSLGDWEKVRKVYNIDEEKYQKHIETKRKWQAILDRVPDEFMTAMKETMTRQEIDYFINRMNIMDIDFDYAWEQYKSGKTTEEIIAEKAEADKKQSQLDTKYIMGEISTEEYVKTVAEVTKGDEATIGKILSDVQILRTEVRNRHKIRSGITDEEIAYCAAKGITNPMDMFQAKYISKSNNIPLETVVASKIKNDDWITVAAEVLNIPLEEYRAMVEQAKRE